MPLNSLVVRNRSVCASQVIDTIRYYLDSGWDLDMSLQLACYAFDSNRNIVLNIWLNRSSLSVSN